MEMNENLFSAPLIFEGLIKNCLLLSLFGLNVFFFKKGFSLYIHLVILYSFCFDKGFLREKI